MTLATRAGATADPVGKAGLAAMTVRTIDMGTKTRKALEIEDALGDLGASLAGAANRDYATVSSKSWSATSVPPSSILSDVVQNATFPDSEVDREKKRQIDMLRQQEKNGGAIASRVRDILAFGPDHPYGHPAQGLPRTIEGMSQRETWPRSIGTTGSQAVPRWSSSAASRSPGPPSSRASTSAPGAAAPPRRSRFRRRTALPPDASISSIGRTRRRPRSSSSCRRRSARRPTTIRCSSPTRSGAAAGSAHAST